MCDRSSRLATKSYAEKTDHDEKKEQIHSYILLVVGKAYAMLN